MSEEFLFPNESTEPTVDPRLLRVKTTEIPASRFENQMEDLSRSVDERNLPVMIEVLCAGSFPNIDRRNYSIPHGKDLRSDSNEAQNCGDHDLASGLRSFVLAVARFVEERKRGSQNHRSRVASVT